MRAIPVVLVCGAILATPVAALERHAPENTPYRHHDVEHQSAAQPAETGKRLGPFLLPLDATDTIVLDHDIEESAWADFEKALAARPGAGKLLLNSDGGLVAEAIDIAREVAKRGITTLVPKEAGCYSACAYIFFAGRLRHAEGELGVHQISGDDLDTVSLQSTLSELLDALHEFGVEETVVSAMLRTPPDEMYVFTPTEMTAWAIDRESVPGGVSAGAAGAGAAAR